MIAESSANGSHSSGSEEEDEVCVWVLRLWLLFFLVPENAAEIHLLWSFGSKHMSLLARLQALINGGNQQQQTACEPRLSLSSHWWCYSPRPRSHPRASSLLCIAFSALSIPSARRDPTTASLSSPRVILHHRWRRGVQDYFLLLPPLACQALVVSHLIIHWCAILDRIITQQMMFSENNARDSVFWEKGNSLLLLTNSGFGFTFVEGDILPNNVWRTHQFLYRKWCCKKEF